MVKQSDMSSLKPGRQGIRGRGRSRAWVCGLIEFVIYCSRCCYSSLAESRHGLLEVPPLPGPQHPGLVPGRHAPLSTIQVRQPCQERSHLPLSLDHKILCSQLCCAESGSWWGCGRVVVMYECKRVYKLIINCL